MRKAAAMLEHGASAAEVLKHFLPQGELGKFNPYHLGPGPGGGQFTTAEMDATGSGNANPQGYATNLSEDEILDQAQDNQRTPGWLQPKDVKRGNEKECVSLLRAVIPELPHSSQWQEGDPVTPENAAAIPPGTAIATFEDGRYGNAATGNHAAIFLGPHVDDDGSTDGIVVVDQSDRFRAQGTSFLSMTQLRDADIAPASFPSFADNLCEKGRRDDRSPPVQISRAACSSSCFVELRSGAGSHR